MELIYGCDNSNNVVLVTAEEITADATDGNNQIQTVDDSKSGAV